MNKYRKLSITLLIISVIFIILGGTLSLWTWTSSENKNVVFNTASNLQDYIIYDEGESKFVGDFQVSDSYLDGVHTTISLYKTEEVSNVDLYATINMDINSIGTNIKSLPGLKWVVTSGNSTDSNHEILSQGNFLGTNDGDTLVLYNNIEVLTTKKEFTIWLWLDSSTNLDSELTGETIDTSVWTQIDQIVEDRYEITNLSVYNKMISATVVNSTANIMYYQVTTSNTEPTEWIEIPEEDIGNIYTLEYNSINSGTNYVWFKDSNNKVISKDIYVSATYNITYLDVGGTTFSGIHEEEYPQAYNMGSITYLDIPTKEGYSFFGYYLNSDGSGEVITNISDSQTGDITLYAKWIDNIAPHGAIESTINDNVVNAKLTIDDYGSGVLNQYGWAITTNDVCDSSLNGSYISSQNLEYNFTLETSGVYYVCVKASDNAGNIGYIKSKPIGFINETFSVPNEYEYVVPLSGYYQLEVWGAQGGYGKSSTYRGGYGGYSTGIAYLEKGTTLYINVGGQGENAASAVTQYMGGYNGGGSGKGAQGAYNEQYAGGGGGATHIATTKGLLSSLSENQESILIVAGGGGGGLAVSDGNYGYGGNGGGYQGDSGASNSQCGVGTGGTQSSGASFGKGQDSTNSPGGGGGYYGGKASGSCGGSGGGSGYIGNLIEGETYIYNGDASDNAISYFAKKGNGSAKITYISETYDKDEIINVGESILLSQPTNYELNITVSGYYQLEVWGAQGGTAKGKSNYRGGYGGYSTGIIYLETGTNLYVTVGGQGQNAYYYTHTSIGGYNGGGSGKGSQGAYNIQSVGGGGGATHIATAKGLLSSLSENQESILIVAGGGGGGIAVSDGNYGYGGSGGGYQGATGTSNAGGGVGAGGTQSSGASFGQGQDSSNSPGGGGGYYGGKASGSYGASGGGSGYIGNSLLTDKYMYCYNCTTSDEESTKTYTTTNVSSTPTSNYAKTGNGYAIITLVSKD